MPIEFSCPSCGQRYRVKDDFAGNSTRCTKCSSPLKVPAAAPAVEEASDIDDLLDVQPAAAPPVTAPPAAAPTCPACRARLAPGAVLCVACGYDLIAKRRRATQRPGKSDRPRSKEPSSAWILLKGTAASAVGAVLGAFVWAAVAVTTGFEIGWIAWGVGAAAGAGMAYGTADWEDGTLPGIIAAGVSLAGITLGKALIILWFLIPLLADRDLLAEVEGPEFDRQIVAGLMVNEAYEKRGLDPLGVTEETRKKDVDAALASLRTLSDEEIHARRDAVFAKHDSPPVDSPAVELPQVVDDDPSIIGIFFSTMFGPMDALFIGLAICTAYKLGSGLGSD